MQLTIEKLVYGGDGLARLPADESGPGKAVFVPFVLEGERVEASITEEKRGFARADAEKILVPSEQRIEPGCPYFGACGGCHYQHTSYEHQLEIKAAILKENLRRIAKVQLDKEIVIHPSPPWNYRNRARLKVEMQPNFALGYYKFNSHELLPVERCPIGSQLINRTITSLWTIGRERSFPTTIQEIDLFANPNDDQVLVSIYVLPGIDKALLEEWSEELQRVQQEIIGIVGFPITRQHRSPSLTEPNPILLCGKNGLACKTAADLYRATAGAFFQVNRHLNDELVKVVCAELSGDHALDLYAGVGLFSVPLARRFAQVIAVEASPISHGDLVHNSPRNVKAVRDTTDHFLSRAANLRPNLVVVDPPRSGLGEKVVRSLVALRSNRIAYVSCDPATVSRDLTGLLSAGYRIEQAHLVDLFPQTFHLESVFHLVR